MTPESIITEAFEILLVRRPTPDELQKSMDLLKRIISEIEKDTGA